MLGERNIDPFGRKFRLRMKTPDGEIRETFDNLDAAISRRVELRTIYPDTLAHRFRARRMPTKGSHERVGVCRTVKTDRRKAGKSRYLVYAVNWIDTAGRKRVTSFQAGPESEVTAAEERHAELTAIAFREAYEYARMQGTAFDQKLFAEWRLARCYPFKPPGAHQQEAFSTPIGTEQPMAKALPSHPALSFYQHTATGASANRVV